MRRVVERIVACRSPVSVLPGQVQLGRDRDPVSLEFRFAVLSPTHCSVGTPTIFVLRHSPLDLIQLRDRFDRSFLHGHRLRRRLQKI